MNRFFALILALLTLAGCHKCPPCNEENTQPEPEEVIKSYKIGDLYDKDGIKGLVFRVDESGQSGLIVSLTEPTQMKAWSTEFVLTDCNIRSCGEQNTAIIYTLPDWQSKYPAFEWCASLGQGWYIPAADELYELLLIGSSNTFATAIATYKATPFATEGKYLSSTEMDEYWVYLVDVTTLKQSANYKQYTYHTRAIRHF